MCHNVEVQNYLFPNASLAASGTRGVQVTKPEVVLVPMQGTPFQDSHTTESTVSLNGFENVSFLSFSVLL